MITHHLKLLPEYFGPVKREEKTFEIRKNDRRYQVGDVLILEEFGPDGFTERTVVRKVTFITDFAQQPGYIVMGMQPI